MTTAVLHITPGLMIGGGQRIALDVVQELSRRSGFQARLCVLGPSNGLFAPAAPVYIDYTGPYNDLRVMTRAAMDLRDVLDEVRPDIVHTHAWELDLLCAAALPGRHVAHVAHIHDLRHWLESRRFRHAITRGVTRFCRLVSGARYIAVSEFVRGAIHRRMGWNGTLVSVVHNGVDAARFDCDASAGLEPVGSTPAPATVGVAARLETGKGIDVLLRAWQRVVVRHPAARLRIAGVGQLQSDLVALAERLELGERVEFTGFVANMPAFYRSLDIFVLPSVASEGMPMTVLEAMASRKPVIATRVGGTAEQIIHGQSGLLVQANDVDSLATAISDLLDDTACAKAMGRIGRQRVDQRFSTRAMVDRIVEVYRGLK
jgi:glycosyltransferase involved in cell wall biosynthesis